MNNQKIKIHPLLIKAYREAIYVVNTDDGQLSLKIGQVNHGLAALLKKHQVTTAAFITAYNPFSKIADNASNEAQQESLFKDLSLHSSVIFKGEGRDAKNEWIPEPSYLALGISLHMAEQHADNFGQNGFVWINNQDGLVSLRLRGEVSIPPQEEVDSWLGQLSESMLDEAKKLNAKEIAWMMSVSDAEQSHWLNPAVWDLNLVWPLATPEGLAMGIGTELDRMFRLVAAGNQRVY